MFLWKYVGDLVLNNLILNKMTIFEEFTCDTYSGVFKKILIWLELQEKQAEIKRNKIISVSHSVSGSSPRAMGGSYYYGSCVIILSEGRDV